MNKIYYRPIPVEHGRWQIAGGWTRFSRLEALERGTAPRITDTAPPEVLAALTAPRSAVLGLSMDRPRIMGIVNATPDSFSDGGSYDGAEHARRLVAQGAEILDIGGESTRPGAQQVQIVDEIARVTPVIAQAAALAAISVDTRKAAVAEAAVRAGAGLVNDVSGFDFDVDMAATVAGLDVPVCIMHAQGVPETMQDSPIYGDVLLDVYDALELRIARAEAAGIPRDRIVIDPGIGFGKTQAHNLAILRRISLYHGLGCAILLGVSRKRFIGAIGGAEHAADRAAGTLAVTLAGVAQGIQIHRVHDVEETRQGLALWRAVTGEGE
ncbi:dihydropteroate synthase [Paracoccus laeviglucosivorans]|uniref:Dihydropteroate synthase n=1 Tax=Paracoccus laeviglucosivorans TaxID=1197861 RepID=A0A521ARY8_9RHOB|nr:dihydropteroate synthase [Paracoccus laeviglucosivorans]SMO37541.1 Dihydropteroate synthase [Paracoccus laeviglucosivorans]